jgi:hypothetical protein
LTKEHIRKYCSENEVEKVRQLTQILCILSFSDVTSREIDVLCEILYHGGVNDKAKKSFTMNYKTSKENYGQVIKRLSDKGILIDKPFRSGKDIHPEFNLLKKYFLDMDKGIFVILSPN